MGDPPIARASLPATLAALVLLGMSAGAMLTEGAVLVPYWRSLGPADFLAWFRDNEPRLVAFFGPLQVACLLLVGAAAVLAARARSAGAVWLACAALLTLATLALYPLYFRSVNASFATGAIPPAEVAAALARWARWHWLRTGIGVAAFVAGLYALRRHDA